MDFDLDNFDFVHGQQLAPSLPTNDVKVQEQPEKKRKSTKKTTKSVKKSKVSETEPEEKSSQEPSKKRKGKNEPELKAKKPKKEKVVSDNKWVQVSQKIKISQREYAFGLNIPEEDENPGLTILKHWYSVPISNISHSSLEKICEDLTVQPTKNDYATDQPLPPVIMYHKTATRLYVPPNYGFTKFGEPELDLRREGLPMKNRFDDKKYPLDTKRKQDQAYTALMKRFKETHRQSGYLCLPPGGGKTTMAYKMGSDLGRAMGVIVTKDFLMSQWGKRGRTFVPGVKIGKVQQNDIVYKDCDVIIFMLHTMLAHLDDPTLMEALNCCGMMVIDEARHINAAQFSRVLPMLTSKYILALDGTPHREDGMDMVLQHWIGHVSFECKREYTTNVRVKVLNVPYEPVKESFTVIGKLNVAKMTTELALKQQRNDAIIRELVDHLVPTDRQILVLGERVSHLEELMEMLRGEIPDASIGHFYSGLSKNEEEMIEIEAKQIIFATYKMAEEALDIPSLSILFHLSPRKDVKQCVGRIMRGVSSHDPLIVELYDYYTLWAGFFEVRHTFYRNEGYEIEFPTLDLVNKHKTRGANLTKETKNSKDVWILKKDVSKKKVSTKKSTKRKSTETNSSKDQDNVQKKRQCRF